MLVAKSLAVPIGITAMASDLGASSFTSALATCAFDQTGGQDLPRTHVACMQ